RIDGAVRERRRPGLASNGCRGGGSTTGEMQRHNVRGVVESHACGYGISPVAAVRGITRVTKPRHSLDPHARNPFRVIASFARLARETETRHRWNDHMKTVFDAASVSRWIGERADHFFIFNDGAWPSVQQQ